MNDPKRLGQLVIVIFSVFCLVGIGGVAWLVANQDQVKRLLHNEPKSERSGYSAAATAYGSIRQLTDQGDYQGANRVFVSSYPEAADYQYWLKNQWRNQLGEQDKRGREIAAKVSKALDDKDFAALDKLIAELRSSKEMMLNGRWYLDSVYGELDNMPHGDSSRQWHERIDLLKEWKKQCPQSTAAPVALSFVLSGYAWKARGSGWADSVSDQGWKLFRERLEESWDALQTVKDRPPEWYSAAGKVALGQGWDRKRYEQMYSECRQKYPSYNSVVFNKLYWLQPRWYGQESEAEKFLASEADKVGGEDGDILYARSVWSLDKTIGHALSETALSWPRTQKGMTALISRRATPQGKVVLSTLAMEAGDQTVAANAFRK